MLAAAVSVIYVYDPVEIKGNSEFVILSLFHQQIGAFFNHRESPNLNYYICLSSILRFT